MRNTIKNHNDFKCAVDDPMARSAFFIVRAIPAKFRDDPRYGLVVTKRTFKLAVHRNRAKRLLRDWLQFHSYIMLPEFDYIFIARAPILTATRDEGRFAMEKALSHIYRKYGTKKKKKSLSNQ